jgi:hypothetical protein
MIEEEVAALVAQFTVGEYEDEWQLEELGLALKALIHLTARRLQRPQLEGHEARRDRGRRAASWRMGAYAAKKAS